MRLKMWVILSAVINIMAIPVLAAPLQALDYSILISGRVAGHTSVESPEADQLRIIYNVNDRGRGAEHVTTLHIGQNNLPTALTMEGVTYWKTPFKETFSFTDERAQWQSAVDKGSATGSGFYLPNEYVAAHLGFLAQTLLTTPSHEVRLFPGGVAKLIKMHEEVVRAGEKSQKVTLYLIQGLNFTSFGVWLDEKGKWFQVGGNWITIRQGWEAEAERLYNIEKSVLTEASIKQAQQIIHKSDRPIVFRDVAVFDTAKKILVPHQTVIIRSNRIDAVVPVTKARIPKKALIIEGNGKTLMPGLWDMHVHINRDTDGLLYLGNGITTVRDLGTVGSDIQTLIDRRRFYDQGRLIGPHIIMAALIDGPGPLAAPTKLIVKTPEKTRSLIHELAGKGYEQIKIYSSFDPKLVPIAVEEAHKLGLRVSGHVPATMTMTDVIRTGFDEVQHANFWMLNFMGSEINSKTNGTTRFTAVGEKGKDIDLSSSEVQQLIELVKQKNIVLDPTIAAFKEILTSVNGVIPSNYKTFFQRFPPVVQRDLLNGGIATDDKHPTFVMSYQNMVRMLKKIYDSGITIVAGTDGFPGFSMFGELEAYSQAGIPNADVLTLATLGAARVMKKDRELGSIEPGKLADLILVDGDPTQDINKLHDLSYVMKNGVLYDPDVLLGAIGVASRKPNRTEP